MRISGAVRWPLVVALALSFADGAAGATTARITSPGPGKPVSGTTSIEVTVETAPGVTVLKVEVSVDGRLLATLLDPPFRALWEAGDGGEPHVIRAKAWASDGSVATVETSTVPRLGIDRARVVLVEVYTTVKDDVGRFIMSLGQNDFIVKEDGVPQRLSLFTSERKPVQVLLLLDVSASMKREERLSTAIEAAKLFVEALEPGDRVSLVTFSDEVKTLEPFSDSREKAQSAIASVQPERGTALYDAIFAASGMLGKEEGRRALVLLSDGQDLAYDGMGPGSVRTFEESVAEALRHQVTAYTIGLGENLSNDYDFARRHSAVQVLTRLASDTGGKFLEVRRPGRLRSAFERILDELRFQYTLGYHPTNDRRDGGWRSIEVGVSKPRLIVNARKGYYAPTD